MIFETPKIVFIHIPKTGGTTIEKLLVANKDVGKPVSTLGSHHRLQQVYDRYSGPNAIVEEKDKINLAEYYIFTVGRNPWERYASMYIHDYKVYQESGRRRKKKLPSIEEYMDKNVQETFFNSIEVNDQIPDNLMILNFDDFRNEVKRVFGIMELTIPKRIFHANKKPKEYKEMEQSIIENVYFQNSVTDMCAKEIALFGYDIPSY